MLPLVVLVFVSACGNDAPHGTPEDAVRALFAAVERRECDAMSSVVAGELEQKISKLGCEEVLHELEEHGFRLVGIDATEVDGRDANARLVRVRVLTDGEESRAIVRAELIDNRWKVTLL